MCMYVYLFHNLAIAALPSHIELQQSVQTSQRVCLGVTGGIEYSASERGKAFILDKGVGEGGIAQESLQLEYSIFSGAFAVGVQTRDQRRDICGLFHSLRGTGIPKHTTEDAEYGMGRGSGTRETMA